MQVDKIKNKAVPAIAVIAFIACGYNIIKNYNDIENKIAEITKNRPFFITVGAAYSHKNMFRLIGAVELLNNKEIVFLIVGKKNEYLQSVENFASGKNLDQVKFLNYVDDNLLAGLYAKAIANIYLSLYEGFGFPPLEAASLGTISLVSDIPVMREVLGDHAFFVDSQSHAAIAEKLNLIIQQYESKNLFANLKNI